MRSARLLFLLCAVTSLASAQNFRVLVTLPGWSRHPMALDTVSAPYEIDAPAGRVFSAFASALDELKIPITERDSAGGLVGNAKLQQRHTFAGMQLSKLVNCGLSAMGPNANTYQVHAALIAFIDPLGPSKTRIRIAFAAGALDSSGAAKEPASCGSTGVLEERLADMVKQRLR